MGIPNGWDDCVTFTVQCTRADPHEAVFVMKTPNVAGGICGYFEMRAAGANLYTVGSSYGVTLRKIENVEV